MYCCEGGQKTEVEERSLTNEVRKSRESGDEIPLSGDGRRKKENFGLRTSDFGKERREMI